MKLFFHQQCTAVRVISQSCVFTGIGMIIVSHCFPQSEIFYQAGFLCHFQVRPGIHTLLKKLCV